MEDADARSILDLRGLGKELWKGLIANLGCGPVGLDTAVLIYFIEEHSRFLPVVAPVFSAVASARLTAITSGVTLIETLVILYRSGNAGLAARYEALLTRSRGVSHQ